MKTLALCLLFVFIGCSTTRDNKQSNDDVSDLVMTEQALKKCFDDKTLDGLKLLKKQFKSNSIKYWNSVGSCYFIRGNLNKALVYFQQALTIDSKNPAVLHNLALVFSEKSNPNKAIGLYEKVLQTNKGFSITKFNLAHLYLKYGLVHKSNRMFKDLEAANSQDPVILSGLGITYYLLNQNQLALNYFKRLPDHYIQKAVVANYYTMLLNDLGKNQQARKIASVDHIDESGVEDFTNKVKKLVLSD